MFNITCFENRAVILSQVEISAYLDSESSIIIDNFLVVSPTWTLMFGIAKLNCPKQIPSLLFSSLNAPSFHLPTIQKPCSVGGHCSLQVSLVWLVKGLLLPLSLEEHGWGLGDAGSKCFLFSFWPLPDHFSPPLYSSSHV